MNDRPSPFVTNVAADVGPLVRLPGVAMTVATVVGAVAVAAPAYFAIQALQPAAFDVIAPAIAIAIAAHLGATLFERPWRLRRLGQWPFVILRASMVSAVAVPAAVVLLYSLTPLEAAALSLVAAGAWLTGFFAKVLVFGRFAKKAEAEPFPTDDAANAPQ